MNTLDFHFIHRFHQQVQALSHRPALRFMQNEKWSEISWLELQKQVNNLSYALLANGLAVQEKSLFLHKICLVGQLPILLQCKFVR